MSYELLHEIEERLENLPTIRELDETYDEIIDRLSAFKREIGSRNYFIVIRRIRAYFLSRKREIQAMQTLRNQLTRRSM